VIIFVKLFWRAWHGSPFVLLVQSMVVCPRGACFSPPPPSLSLLLSMCPQSLHLAPPLPLLRPPMKPSHLSIYIKASESFTYCSVHPTLLIIITPITPHFFVNPSSLKSQEEQSLCVHSCVPYSCRPILSSACHRRRRQTALAALRAGGA
jgi:hypothetical protein